MGTILTVEKDSFSQYSSIAQALQTAAAGDTIVVKPGCYNEAIVLDKSVEIRAEQIGVTVECQGDTTFLVTAKKAVVRGLTIRQLGGEKPAAVAVNKKPERLLQVVKPSARKDKAAVVVLAGNSLFEDCWVQAQATTGVLLVNANTNPLFKNCTITGSRADGVQIAENAQGCFESCRIFDNKESNVAIQTNGNARFEHCQIYEGQGNGIRVHDGGLGQFLSCDIYQNGEKYPNVLIATTGNPCFEQCTIHNSSGAGVFCKDNGLGRFENCRIFDNEKSNILICKEADPLLVHCELFNSKGHGVQVIDCGHGRLQNCKVYRNAFPNVAIKSKGNARFEHCQIYEGQSTDIYVYEDGLGQFLFCDIHQSPEKSPNVWIETAGNPHFEQCTIRNSFDAGIFCKANGLGHFENCRIFDNKKSNVIICNEAEPLFIHCEFFDSKHSGIFVRDSGHGHFKDCNVYKNTRANVTITTNGNARFDHCQIYEGQTSGVYVDEGGLGQFLSCDIYQNSVDRKHPNVWIETAGNPSFKQCTIHNSVSQSIYCADNSLGHFAACEITHSTLENIAVCTGANPSFEKCRIHSGQQAGVWVRKDGLGKFIDCDIQENATVNLRVESSQTIIRNCAKADPPSLEAVLQELNALIGLENVKSQIHKTIQFIKFNKEVSQYGVKAHELKEAASHTVLSGNPGTGKTTVARLLGQLYVAMGLLPSGHVVSVNREKLVGEYIGHTAPKTKKWIDQAIGGILFIDEAYELANKSERDFGSEAIAIILEEMENRRGEFIVVIAGYTREIKLFLETSPGLNSRFNQQFDLPDYSPEEMRQIAEKLYRDKQRTITPDSLRLLVQEFTRQWRKRDRFFANARMVRNLVDLSLQQQAERCMATAREAWNQEFLTTVTGEDVQAVLPKASSHSSYVLPIQEKALGKTLYNLDRLIGLQPVKNEIHKLVTLMRYYREEGKDIEALSPHTVLKGSPGTGKTEVARIIAGIYAALGILERGDLVEVNRDKLVRPHAGESEKITAQFIEQAMGGVLFIDEAYQLTQYGPSDPGHKVVEVLLKHMEDQRGKFIVIAAGYPAQMDQFLDSNDGLRRRFARHLEFEDYTADELMQISAGLLLKSGYYLEETANQAIKEHFIHAYLNRDRSFGNAGFARNVITETIKNTDYRVAMTPKEQRTPELSKKILSEDIAVGI